MIQDIKDGDSGGGPFSYEEIMTRLRSMKDPNAIAGMARFGINPDSNLGIGVTELRKMAREIGKDHGLALRLWSSGIRDARILAASIDDPAQVTKAQMESWAKDFDSWDICDHCCGHLFDKTPFAYEKAIRWSSRKEEFVKRAGFALMAWLPLHDKKALDDKFLIFLPPIKKGSIDDRNYVKKAVSWALRNIGKRSRHLNRSAIRTARDIKKLESKSARWVASDVLRELTSDADPIHHHSLRISPKEDATAKNIYG
jgi:3-methyladenine DNA glycosylase AlkD